MNDKTPVVRANERSWSWAVATCAGIGLSQPGPGTRASAVATFFWWVIAECSRAFTRYIPTGANAAHQSLIYNLPLLTLLLATLATILGIPAATRVAEESGREDPGHVVIDEVAGQWLTLVVCKPDWPHALVALALFRIFDITKPWPIRKLEKLPGGWGIMLDDLAAGLFGLIVLLVIQHWW